MSIRLSEKPNFIVEIANGYSGKLLREIIKIEEDSFESSFHYDDMDSFFKEMLEDESNISLVLRSNGKAVGYLLGRPHNDVRLELIEDDPLIKEDNERYYIETMEIMNGYRSRGGFTKLIFFFIRTAQKRNINKYSAHARVTNGLFHVIKKLFSKDITLARDIPAWKHGNNEPYKYIEITLRQSLLFLKFRLLLHKIIRSLSIR
ncbi:MAG: GNAT family N-acetyltransferase [Parcubacteria group bacterium]|jgi:hypothetical protein